MTAQRSEDGRHIVVGGRRWRAADPSIPAQLRQELVHELMAARRAVGGASTQAAEQRARARVHDAKVALGERGRPWWEESDPEQLHERLASAARALLRKRAPEASICPSDLARVAGGPAWRETAMNAARDVAAAMANDGVLSITQGDVEVTDAADPASWRGPVRLRRGPAFPAPPED